MLGVVVASPSPSPRERVPWKKWKNLLYVTERERGARSSLLGNKCFSHLFACVRACVLVCFVPSTVWMLLRRDDSSHRSGTWPKWWWCNPHYDNHGCHCRRSTRLHSCDAYPRRAYHLSSRGYTHSSSLCGGTWNCYLHPRLYRPWWLRHCVYRFGREPGRSSLFGESRCSGLGLYKPKCQRAVCGSFRA